MPKNDTLKVETQIYSVATEDGIVSVEATSTQEAVTKATRKGKEESNE